MRRSRNISVDGGMQGALTGLAERRLTEVLEARLAEEPVIVLNGPRTVGRSTLLSQLAQRLRRPVIDCDDRRPEQRYGTTRHGLLRRMHPF